MTELVSREVSFPVFAPVPRHPAGSSRNREVLRGVVVDVPGYVSPLAGGGHCLIGGVVTDPWAVAGIAARVEWFSRPWWRRVGRRVPVGPALAVAPSKIIMPSPVEAAS